MTSITKLLAIGAMLMLGACSDGPGAQRALDDAGFTEIRTTGWTWFGGCGKGDFYVTRFTARNIHGKPISGVVCSGWFKGSTIRFD